jgi:16S rRNA U1498 N3-methylase RsmE
MGKLMQINDTIQLLIMQGNKINRCIKELEKQRINLLINEVFENNQEIESDIKKVMAKVERINKELVKIRSPYYAK